MLMLLCNLGFFLKLLDFTITFLDITNHLEPNICN